MGLRLQLSKEDMIAFFLIFPFIPVNALNAITGDILYDLLALVNMAYIFVLCIRNRHRFNAMEISLSIYVVILCASCVLNGRSIIPGIYYGGKLLAFILINNYYLEKGSTTLLRVIYKYMTILIVINTFFQYFAQDAFGHQVVSGNYNNFLAGDNLLGYNYVPYITLAIVLDRIEHVKICNKTKLMILICTASLIKAWSGKSIVGIAMVLAYLLFIYRKRIAKLLTFNVLTIAIAAIYIGIVFFNIQEYFSAIIEVILKKDATLTGRTYIWSSTIDLIKLSPIYGYGTINGGMLNLSLSRGGNSVGSHNLLLEVILQTGFTGLVFYVLFFFFSLKKRVGKLTEEKKEVYLMILFMIFTILTMFITSMTIYTIIVYLPLILCFNVDRIKFKSL